MLSIPEFREEPNKFEGGTQKILSLNSGKEAFYREIDMECGAAYEYAAEIMVKTTVEPDAHEGINAFFDKREP